MSTRSIRTSDTQTACDICGRTLLRGEHAEIYIAGGSRRSVCELCTSRALHGGWVREGEMPDYDDAGRRPDRRRSLFGRLRARRDSPGPRPQPEVEEDFDEYGYAEEADGYESEYPDPDAGLATDDPWAEEPPPVEDVAPPRPSRRPVPAPRRAFGGRRSAASGDGAGSRRGLPGRGAPGREPRHIRAVPTSMEQRSAAAIKLFNESEHPRTVAGIARSLGLPDVSVRPAALQGSALVHLVVSWELCWYRYEVDLADEVPSVRIGAQGYELSELAELERQNNAFADDRGRLSLGR